MSATSKSRKGPAAASGRTVTYRGVRIAPLPGRRSPLARAIREGLIGKAEQPRGEPTPA